MPVTTETVSVPTPDGAMDLFVARPESAGPGLVVLQEAFGVNDHIKDVTRRFAAEGYLAVAPDLFHRAAQRTIPYDQVREAIGAVMQLTDDMVMADINAAIGWLRSQPGTGKIGVLGYCFGGRSAYLAATRSREIAAAVGYYPGGAADPRNPDAPVTHTADIAVPILLFFGGQDRMVPVDQVAAIDAALKAHGKSYQLKVYPEAGHGFFCDARESYDPAAASDAWSLTLEFLAKHLR
ncbi:MAG TPA: dienelactone hydrolase family protein [Chloroflexota bacterium]|nr:dienelactone hydrolase family protein [Chloroflexota bacterium]